jgi:hypothetical protein
MTARTKGHRAKNEITQSEPSNSPYEMYRETQVWKIVDKAINDLVVNNDLAEKTRRDYIVGYLCKNLQEILIAEPGRSNH